VYQAGACFFFSEPIRTTEDRVVEKKMKLDSAHAFNYGSWTLPIAAANIHDERALKPGRLVN
jgi:hypothetical protein